MGDYCNNIKIQVKITAHIASIPVYTHMVRRKRTKLAPEIMGGRMN